MRLVVASAIGRLSKRNPRRDVKRGRIKEDTMKDVDSAEQCEDVFWKLAASVCCQYLAFGTKLAALNQVP